jgi:hypothetical protein
MFGAPHKTDACLMWDKRSVIGLVILAVVTLLYNVYLYQLFLGWWETTTAKELYYTVTTIFLAYLTIEDITGFSSARHRQVNLISKFILILTFLLFSLTLYGYLPEDKLSLFLFNGCIFTVSVIILTIGPRKFKD